MRAWSSAAALVLAWTPQAAAQTPGRTEGTLVAFRPLPADAAMGPAALDRMFDAMRAAPPLPVAPWRRVEPVSPKREAKPQPKPAPARLNPAERRPATIAPGAEGSGEPVRELPLLIPPPAETPGYRHTFRVLMARPHTTDRYDRLLLEHAERRGLNPRLLKAIIAAESEFVERARSPKGALGLMQLAPPTAAQMGVGAERLTDPESNIRAGASYLRWLFERAWKRYRLSPSLPFSQAPLWVVQRVIAAYNGGPRFLTRDALFAETREYLRKVLLFLRSPVAVLRRHAPLSAERPIVPPTIHPR